MSPLVVAEAAIALRISPWTVRRAARAGHLRGTYQHGKWTFDEADIAAYRAKGENMPPEAEVTRRRRKRAS